MINKGGKSLHFQTKILIIMIHATTTPCPVLSAEEMLQANGGALFPAIISTTIGDIVNSINSIDIEAEGGCQHP